MSQFFELHYHLPEDPARLFDVAHGWRAAAAS